MLGRMSHEGTLGVQYGKMDVDANRAVMEKLGVVQTPETRIYFRGQVMARFVGFRAEGPVRQLVRKSLWKAKPVVVVEEVTNGIRRLGKGDGTGVKLPPGVAPLSSS